MSGCPGGRPSTTGQAPLMEWQPAFGGHWHRLWCRGLHDSLAQRLAGCAPKLCACDTTGPLQAAEAQAAFCTQAPFGLLEIASIRSRRAAESVGWRYLNWSAALRWRLLEIEAELRPLLMELPPEHGTLAADQGQSKSQAAHEQKGGSVPAFRLEAVSG